jgi:hypothetical protein
LDATTSAAKEIRRATMTEHEMLNAAADEFDAQIEKIKKMARDPIFLNRNSPEWKEVISKSEDALHLIFQIKEAISEVQSLTGKQKKSAW